MPPATRPPTRDPQKRFEPGWRTPLFALWLSALFGVGIVRTWWPGTIPDFAVRPFVVIWALGFGGIGLAALVTAAVRRARLRHADREDLCRCCGYDLRASPGRCPECGAERTSVGPGAP